MPRAKTKPAETLAPTPPKSAAAQSVAEQQLMVAHQSKTTAIAKAVGIDTEVVPYSREVYITQIESALHASGLLALRIGQLLTVIKSRESREDFRAVLNRLALSDSYAAEQIKLAHTFTQSDQHKLFAANQSLSKLVTMRALCSPEEIDQIVNGGEGALVSADEIERMSVRELQAALRAERDEQAKTTASFERQLKRQKKKNDELDEQLGRYVDSTAAEKAQNNLKEAGAVLVDLMSTVHKLKTLMGSIDVFYDQEKADVDEHIDAQRLAIGEKARERLDELLEVCKVID